MRPNTSRSTQADKLPEFLLAMQAGDEARKLHFNSVKNPGWDARQIEFWDCTFEECDLESARLERCSFFECTFKDCNLSLTSLDHCRFRTVTFESTKLLGIDWTMLDRSGPDLGQPLMVSRCVLDHSTFLGLSLTGLKIKDCQANEVDFREAQLGASDLRGTDLKGALFDGADLSGADLRGCKGYEIDPRRTELTGARFSLPEAIALLEKLEIELSAID
jgi:uncharacterized protein YjbI with pentapeptide repeats